MDGRVMRSGPSSSDLVSSSEDLNPKNIVVGISEDLKQLKEQLIMPHQSTLEIIPIVGMGGIGKTTLAQTLYNDQDVVSNFDTRAWVAISQRYSEKEMLLGLLKCIIGSLSDKMVHQDENDELGLQLYKNLKGRKYLIVLDDMWSREAWDCIRMFFPNENNRSRILVTTREQNVAKHVAGSENLHHQMKLLNEVEGWKLLRQKVFSDGSYSLELEEVGKNIAKDCKGLPLAIHVVGGVVSRLEKIQEAWMQVAKDVGSFVNHDHISNILSLSYNHLPNYLKPCFLYMGAFPEDRHIRASKLIRLWMAEGFLKPILGMNFEEAARVYLRELVEMNLVLVVQQGAKRKAKSYIMHDLLRDLCISKAREEKFLYIGIGAIKDLKPEEMLRLRLGIHGVHVSDDECTRIIESQHMPSVVCSILLFAKAGGHHKLSWLDTCSSGLRLLKVLDVLEANCAVLPQAIERLINLRYLAVRAISYSVPDTITSLCNLQTLILHLGSGSLFHLKVKELLNMPQLRHVTFKGACPPFVLKNGGSFNVVNEELQTLSMVEIDESFPRILQAIPNLKKLGIACRSVYYSSNMVDLTSLSQLQILKLSEGRLLEWGVKFPHSLEKLTLESCTIYSGFLNKIGRLPKLHVFRAKHCYLSEYSMGEWKPTAWEFQQLRLLQLQDFRGLKMWIADETHYPRLEHLIISSCSDLKEIPNGIGDIATLEIIHVHNCSNSVEESARKIQKEQIEYGNDTLQLSITAASKELQRIAAALEEARTALEEAEEARAAFNEARAAFRKARAAFEKPSAAFGNATENLASNLHISFIILENAKTTLMEAKATLAEAEEAIIVAAEEETTKIEAKATLEEAKSTLVEAEEAIIIVEAEATEAKTKAEAKATLAEAEEEAVTEAEDEAKATLKEAKAILEGAKTLAEAKAREAMAEAKVTLAGEKVALARAPIALVKAKAELLLLKAHMVDENVTVAMVKANADLPRLKVQMVHDKVTVAMAKAAAAARAIKGFRIARSFWQIQQRWV